jgi:zinc and cadmium transporter
MSGLGYLVVYSALVLLFSMLGGYLPFLGKVSHSRLQFYLSISAGVMLGAAFFHIMPEAMEFAKGNFGWWMSLGAVGLFCIERFIAPHSHEIDGGGHHHHGHEHGEGEHHHDHHEHVVKDGKEHRAAAPPVAGWMAVLGLTIHTFMNGVGLAGSVLVERAEPAGGFLASLPLPGLAMFLAIVLHKPADALAISTILSRKGVSRGVITLVQLGFACMVPVGAIAFYFLRSTLAEQLEGELIGAALSFSAGTFLFIALSDLLPEVQFHRHDRVPLFLSLVFGVALMGGIALLEGHDSHGGHGHNHHHGAVNHGDGKHDDHDDDDGHEHDHGKEAEHDHHDHK